MAKKSRNCNRWYSLEGDHHVSSRKFRGVWLNIAETWRFFNFVFFKLAAVGHLGLIVCVFGPPTKSILRYLSQCTLHNLILNISSRCDNMKVLIFNEFGLQMPIHTLKTVSGTGLDV